MIEILKYKDAIWDFDGTLFDTYPHIAKTLCEALKGLGCEAPYEEALALMSITFGHGFKIYADKLGLTSDEVKAAYRAAEARLGWVDTATPFPYVEEALQFIIDNGGRNFVFTHKGASVNDHLARFDFARYFVDVVSLDSSMKLKPSPDGNLYIMNKHAVAPETAIGIGDRDIDMGAARNSGIASCLFIGGSVAAQGEADYRVSDYRELPAILLR